MIYDSVICVASHHNLIALKAIRSLYRFTQSRRIFVITSRQNALFFKENVNPPISVCLLDEDKIIDNVSLRFFQEYFIKRSGTARRAGWYLQQFLKIFICTFPDVADHYLIWDSDTVLLQPLVLFDQDGRVLVNPKAEYHKPYFEVMKKTLGFGRQVEFSFISEHLVVNKSYMKELIGELTAKGSEKVSWIELILNSIEDQHLGASGFSEFETYGNFIALKHRDSFRCRPLKSTRGGAIYFGVKPNESDIFSLMLTGYVIATFEGWNLGSKWRITAGKTAAWILHTGCLLPACFSKSLRQKLVDASGI